jgi:hypothetical protein
METFLEVAKATAASCMAAAVPVVIAVEEASKPCGLAQTQFQILSLKDLRHLAAAWLMTFCAFFE